MNQLDIVKTISTIKLNNSLENGVGENWEGKKKVVWGAGVSGKNFVDMYLHLGFSYIVDTREKLQNTEFNGVKITSPEFLYEEDPENTIIFLPTILFQELADDLYKRGFKYLIMPNQLNKSGVGFLIDQSDVYDFFNWMNQNQIKYALLRWYHEDLTQTKDIDIMIDSNDIEKLLNCSYFLKNNSKKELSYLDVKWSTPIGLNVELPYFPIKLTEKLLADENMKALPNGVKIIKKEILLYTYIYHVLYQKVEISGLPEDGEKILPENKYFNILNELRNELNIEFEISLNGLWDFIQTSEFKPPIDFVRKWADETKSKYLQKKTEIKFKEGQSHQAVFVFRNWFKDHPELLQKSIEIIIDHGFEKIDVLFLNEAQSVLAQKNIRGGVWNETIGSRLGGMPFALGHFQSTETSTRMAKEAVRKFIGEQVGHDVNCIHASDDEIEAMEYLEIVKG